MSCTKISTILPILPTLLVSVLAILTKVFKWKSFTHAHITFLIYMFNIFTHPYNFKGFWNMQRWVGICMHVQYSTEFASSWWSPLQANSKIFWNCLRFVIIKCHFYYTFGFSFWFHFLFSLCKIFLRDYHMAFEKNNMISLRLILNFISYTNKAVDKTFNSFTITISF